MHAIDAAYQILLAAGKPLHAREIAHRMLEQGLWTTKGKTPEATVDSCITVNMKHLGEASRFRRAGKRIFTLHEEPVVSAIAAPAVTVRPVVPRGPGADVTTQPQTMSFADAAERVLDQFANRRPMH